MTIIYYNGLVYDLVFIPIMITGLVLGSLYILNLISITEIENLKHYDLIA
jgi:hypothetical protein